MFCQYHWVWNESRVEPNKEVIHRLGLICSQTRIIHAFSEWERRSLNIRLQNIGLISLKRGYIHVFVCAIESETRSRVHRPRLIFLINPLFCTTESEKRNRKRLKIEVIHIIGLLISQTRINPWIKKEGPKI